MRFLDGQTARRVTLRVGEASWSAEVSPEVREHTFEGLRFPLGPGILRVDLEDGERSFGPYQVHVELLG